MKQSPLFQGHCNSVLCSLLKDSSERQSRVKEAVHWFLQIRWFESSSAPLFSLPQLE